MISLCSSFPPAPIKGRGSWKGTRNVHVGSISLSWRTLELSYYAKKYLKILQKNEWFLYSCFAFPLSLFPLSAPLLLASQFFPLEEKRVACLLPTLSLLFPSHCTEKYQDLAAFSLSLPNVQQAINVQRRRQRDNLAISIRTATVGCPEQKLINYDFFVLLFLSGSFDCLLFHIAQTFAWLGIGHFLYRRPKCHNRTLNFFPEYFLAFLAWFVKQTSSN